MRRIAAILGVLAIFAFAAPAMAAYPDRTVTIVVPYPAGGPTDQLARIVAEHLSKKFGQNFIVENVTGGSTIIATNKVAKATPDGYTLLLHNLQISANPALFKTLPFDTVKDLKTVLLINRNPLVLVAHPGLEANSLKEFMALAKKKTLKEALPGFGTTGHLTSRLFAQVTKLKYDEVPYRGGAPAVTDLLGGHDDFMIGTPQQMLPLVKAGKLKAIAVTQKGKMSEFPTADSMADLLGPHFSIYYWQGLFAPSKTPEAIIKTLNAAVNDVANDPQVLKLWHDTGVEAFPKDIRTQAASEKYFKGEMARWAKVIKDNKIHVNQ
jgi:tripartite-type tricarboxylate transporter receptor subunit TctC